MKKLTNNKKKIHFEKSILGKLFHRDNHGEQKETSSKPLINVNHGEQKKTISNLSNDKNFRVYMNRNLSAK